MSKKLLFVFNPHSGKAQIKSRLLGIVDTFVKAGYQVDIRPTQSRGDATQVVKERGGGVDRIVVSGGDGTMNEVVTGLMALPREKRPKVGYIPTGTVNDFARGLKIPKDMLKAAKIAVGDYSMAVDVGRMEDLYFTYVTGFGAFTDVSYLTPQDSKNVLGQPAYLFEGIKRLSDLKPQHARVCCDGHWIEDDFLLGLVTNSVSVGGFPGITGKDVELDDGLFEVMLIRNPKNVIDLTVALNELLNDKVAHEFIHRLKASHVFFSFDKDVDWVADGEFGGSRSEVDIRICKKAVDVVRKEP